MSDEPSNLADRAAEMRAAFDRAFAEERRIDIEATENLLAIRLGEAPHAIRLSEITGLLVDKKITHLPSDVSALLGVAGFRGVIVPVYDLGAILGYAPAITPRWLMLAAATPLALAFDASDGYLRIARDMIASRETAAPSQRHVREVARAADRPRPIVNLASVIETVTTRIP